MTIHLILFFFLFYYDIQADRLYPFLLWLVDLFLRRGSFQRIRKEMQNVVEGGNRTTDSVLVCGFVLCSLVVFCVMSSLMVFLALKVVRVDK